MSIRELSLSFHHQEIKIKLPKNYFKTNGKSYPLVIVQDGDYLFKDVKKDVIFVGIVPNNRKKDYTPWKSVVGDIEYGGQADAYITWVADAVIPYLRKCFRISQDRKDIASVLQVPHLVGSYRYMRCLNTQIRLGIIY